MIVTIDISNDCVAGSAPASEWVQHWTELTLSTLQASDLPNAEAAWSGANKPLSLSIQVTDRETAADLNLRYRQKDYATNVLSFASAVPKEILAELDEYPLGDLVICAPVVAEEARQQNKDLQHHWAHMVVHGVLHLCGLDHQDEKEADRMEALETDILTALNIADPYQADAHPGPTPPEIE